MPLPNQGFEAQSDHEASEVEHEREAQAPSSRTPGMHVGYDLLLALTVAIALSALAYVIAAHHALR
jgi:hypothetical protein